MLSLVLSWAALVGKTSGGAVDSDTWLFRCRSADVDRSEFEDAYPESDAGELALRRAKAGRDLPFSREVDVTTDGLRDGLGFATVRLLRLRLSCQL